MSVPANGVERILTKAVGDDHVSFAAPRANSVPMNKETMSVARIFLPMQ